MKINYDVGDDKSFITPCPAGFVSDDYLTAIMIGSRDCRGCPYHADINRTNNVVDCIWPEEIEIKDDAKKPKQQPPAYIISGGVIQPIIQLRDYFAGQALAGLCANPENIGKGDYISGMAYGLADAMLTEREKHNDGGKK